jgi:Tol biopolymer transport system component/tRNA A-37 threonylcarbamoyl transferase component Bud32
MTDTARLAAALSGRYRIERELGAGGMATVYLAHDLKHNRPVAIKVMHPELAAALGSERFLREIEIAARLNHPHILPLLDSGDADGFLFYVMPFAGGQSLRQRLSKGGELPVADAVRLLRDVVDALGHAHAQGVVHRDIKPENILLSGAHALVTDFGVAKAVLDATSQQRLTSEGMAIGTPAYMAPEQAVGDPNVDHRADLYAVGVVAYELLTGRPPFLGATAQAVLSAHVADPPEDVTRLRPAAPPALGQMVMKCLAKKPADRYQSAEEMLPQLDAVLTPSAGTTPTGTQPVAAAHPARRFAVSALVAALVLVLGVVGVRLMLRRPLTLTTSNAIAVTSAPGIEYQPALSPDGGQVAFVAQRDGRWVLSVRSAVAGSGGELRPAEATPGTQQFPSWSPDGEFIRFYSCSTPEACVWREVARLGGAGRVVELPRQTFWTAWSRDGARAAFVVGDSMFVYSPADRSTRLLAVHPDPWGQHSLAWSPDGRWIAYVNSNGSWPFGPNTANSSIWIVGAADGKRIAVTAEDHLNVSPVWLDARHLLFVSNRDGPREVYVVAVGAQGPGGEAQKVAGGTDAYSISLSADGRRLAVAKFEIRQNVWAYPIRASGPVSIRDGRPVTSGTQAVEGHDVSRDGQWLVYDSNLRGNADIYKLRLDGGEPIPILTGPTDEFGPRWSPDGREVAFFDGATVDVFVVSAEGGAAARLTNRPGFNNVFPAWSPDGLRIAFLSLRIDSGSEVWLLARERVGGPWRAPVQLTNFGCEGRGGGGTGPEWAPDGNGVLCSSGTTLVLVSAAGAVQWRRDLTAAGFSQPGAATFSEDGLSLYLSAARGGRNGIWTWPLAGGAPRLVVAFDDLRFVALTDELNVRGDHLYLTVAQNESDIWVMDLKR